MPVSACVRRESAPRVATCRVLTDKYGRIVGGCENTAPLLNTSLRALGGRPLHLFVAQDRPHVLAQMEVATRGHDVAIHTVVRPKERQPRPAHIRIHRVDAHRFAELEWLIELV